MTKQAISTVVLFVESLDHVFTLVESVESISPWMIGGCGVGFAMASAVFIYAVRELLPINGPQQIE